MGDLQLGGEDEPYFCPRPSGDVKLRGVTGYQNVANSTLPEPDRPAKQTLVRSSANDNIISTSTNDFSRSSASPTAVVPVSTSSTLIASALQRLKDSDLETLKMERACGMTPDPARLARLAGPFGQDEDVASVLSGMSGSRTRDVGEGMEEVEDS